jgi:hypothetical protein
MLFVEMSTIFHVNIMLQNVREKQGKTLLNIFSMMMLLSSQNLQRMHQGHSSLSTRDLTVN